MIFCEQPTKERRKEEMIIRNYNLEDLESKVVLYYLGKRKD